MATETRSRNNMDDMQRRRSARNVASGFTFVSPVFSGSSGSGVLATLSGAEALIQVTERPYRNERDQTVQSGQQAVSPLDRSSIRQNSSISGRLVVLRRQQLLHDLIHRESARCLPGWKFPETLQVLPNNGLGRNEQKCVVDEPSDIATRFIIGAFERVGSEIEDFWSTEH